MKDVELKPELKKEIINIFDDDFDLLIYGVFGGIWIMIIYMIIQLVGVFIWNLKNDYWLVYL